MNALFDHTEAYEPTETLGEMLVRGTLIAVLCATTILCAVVGIMGMEGWLS